MDNDRVTNLGFSIDSISTGGLLSGSVDLTVQATQIVHATTCAVLLTNTWLNILKKDCLEPNKGQYLTQNLVGEKRITGQTRFTFHGI